MGEIFPLKNPIQNYAWGSHTILGRMRNVSVPTEQPEAELWVGAHPAAPSVATVDQQAQALNTLVADQPDRFLPAERAADWFPFLFKILAIEAPLSIQVHPTPEQAIAGFEDEQARGIALDAPNRNYKDRYSKPETVIALTDMQVLTGVRETEQLRVLARFFEAHWLSERLGLEPKALLTEIIRMEQTQADDAVEALVAAAASLVDSEDALVADAARLVQHVHAKYPGDRGLLVAFVMNLLHLAPGDSAFTPDGQVHAYVSGSAIELMNPSDNVMRAGLTSKHIDSEELIKVLGEKQSAPIIARPAPEEGPVGVYAMWDERMSVTRIALNAGQELEYTFAGTSALLVVSGQAQVATASAEYELAGTESLLHAGEADTVTLRAGDQPAQLYIAAYV